MEEKTPLLYQDAMSGKLSRRGLLRRAATLGLAAPVVASLLAACGGDEDDFSAPDAGTDTQPDPTPTTEADENNDDDDDATPNNGTPATSAANGDDIAITGPYEGEAQQLNGAGATFPAVLYSRWFHEYEQVTGVRVNYQSIGSGGGIRSISDRLADFGATDGPMNEEQLEAAQGGNIFHIPMALGAVVPTYNIPELNGGDPLRFTPEALAGIYLGDITKWNDPLLVEENPQLADIDQSILVVHRSDGSGTTFIWVDYLASVSETWAENVGVGTSVNWPVGLGGNGNEGVAGEVNQNIYSIGYVELIYAEQNDLGVGHVQNQAGNFIEPTTESVSLAADAFADEISPDLRDRIVNAPGEDSYPISGFTWLLVYEEQQDEAIATALTRMLWWCLTDAQRFNADLGYAPVPESITTLAKEMVWSIKVNGETAFPGE